MVSGVGQLQIGSEVNSTNITCCYAMGERTGLSRYLVSTTPRFRYAGLRSLGISLSLFSLFFHSICFSLSSPVLLKIATSFL